MEGDGLCAVLFMYGPGTATTGCVLLKVRCGGAGAGLRRGETERIVVSVQSDMCHNDYSDMCHIVTTVTRVIMTTVTRVILTTVTRVMTTVTCVIMTTVTVS
jgi:hypothetical protein